MRKALTARRPALGAANIHICLHHFLSQRLIVWLTQGFARFGVQQVGGDGRVLPAAGEERQQAGRAECLVRGAREK